MMQQLVNPEVFDRGHRETIHVSLGALAASNPAALNPAGSAHHEHHEMVAGD